MLRETYRRCLGWRVTRTRLVPESLVPAILEQEVTAAEAHRAWRDLLRRYGEPAPGPAPAGLRVMPEPDHWAQIPSWEWHRAGVDGRRATTVIRACQVARRLEETVDLPAAEAARRLRSVPGIGEWTAAETMQRAPGDADAVSVGDFHLAKVVGQVLVGRPVDDAGMLALMSRIRISSSVVSGRVLRAGAPLSATCLEGAAT